MGHLTGLMSAGITIHKNQQCTARSDMYHLMKKTIELYIYLCRNFFIGSLKNHRSKITMSEYYVTSKSQNHATYTHVEIHMYDS